MMGSNILPPTPEPEPDPSPSPRGGSDLRCEFCESRLSNRGQVLKLSERAKALRDFEDKVEDLKADLDIANAEIAQLRQQVEARDQDIAKLQKEMQKAKKFW